MVQEKRSETGVWPAGDGGMARRIRECNWSATPLGPIDLWPRSLRLALATVLDHPMPMVLAWGPDLLVLYNDAYHPLLGHKPDALGRPLLEVWGEARETIEPQIARALAGESLRFESASFRLLRNGGPEEAVFDYTFSPLRDEAGAVVGVLNTAIEITGRVKASRERARALEALRASEEKFHKLFDSIDEGLAIVEMIYDDRGEIVDMVFREVNRAYERQGGVHDVVGRSVKEVLPRVETYWLDIYERVARTGEPERVENYQRDVDRWFDVHFSRVDESGRFVAIVFTDISNRRWAEAALRESERRQRFLLGFSDALRAEPDADAVAQRALALLCEEMRLDRAYITSYRLEDGRADVTHQFGNDAVPPLPAAFRLSDFPEAFRATHDQTLVIEDEFERQGLSEDERRNSGALGMRAMVAATLRKGANRPLWSMVAMSSQPRRWTPGEIALVEEVTERTWAAMERARAEAALRESDARQRQFANASSDVLWIRDAETLDWQYLSPVFETIYGMERTAALAGEALAVWLDMIVPEDREHAAAHIEQVRRGEKTEFEYRIRRPSDGEVRWLRNSDFPLVDASGRVQRIGGIGRDITEEKRVADRLQVLVAELQHRTRNLLVVIRAVAARTLATSTSLEDFKTRFEERLKALARVNGLLSRLEEGDRIAFDELIATELSGHGLPADDGHGPQVALNGPNGVELRSATVQTFALALHELTTNALKHGALSRPEGRLAVDWGVVDVGGVPHLKVAWRERGVSVDPDVGDEPAGSGYGRELIERALPYQLKAQTRYELGPDGLVCEIVLPISSHGAGARARREGK